MEQAFVRCPFSVHRHVATPVSVPEPFAILRVHKRVKRIRVNPIQPALVLLITRL